MMLNHRSAINLVYIIIYDVAGLSETINSSIQVYISIFLISSGVAKGVQPNPGRNLRGVGGGGG